MLISILPIRASDERASGRYAEVLDWRCEGLGPREIRLSKSVGIERDLVAKEGDCTEGLAPQLCTSGELHTA